mmetsp:Transcript_15527/g.20410  ORF Transcript_15527/g.20410 Transcript_15527/m.20410 type:complete len:175 (+) Transcript_15527:552-1076(+)
MDSLYNILPTEDVEKYMKYPILAVVKAVIENCVDLNSDTISPYIEKWSKLLHKCAVLHSKQSVDEITEDRQRLILDGVYFICSESDATSIEDDDSVLSILALLGDLLPESSGLADKLVLLLHPLYEAEEDLLGEEVILSWFKDTVKNGNVAIAQSVEPYIAWLQEAEEESDDDE